MSLTLVKFDKVTIEFISGFVPVLIFTKVTHFNYIPKTFSHELLLIYFDEVI